MPASARAPRPKRGHIRGNIQVADCSIKDKWALHSCSVRPFKINEWQPLCALGVR